MTWIIGHFLAACIGMSLGLIGGGGSVLALPVLVYFMGIPPKSAIAMTLAIVGTVSLLGVIPHWRAQNIQIKTALIFGSTTMLGAFIGGKIAMLPLVTETFQMMLFGLMMLLAAVFMIRRSSPSVTTDAQIALYPAPICQHCWLWLMTEGLGVGVLTGLVGVGGGFAIVPALVLLAKVPMKQAIGTSLLIIVFNSIAGFLSYWGHISLDWQLTLSFIVAASGGTILGAYLAEFVPANKLQKSFGYFLLAIAALVLLQNRHTPQSTRTSRHIPKTNAVLITPGKSYSSLLDNS